MFCKILKLSLFLLTVTSLVFAESPIKVFYWQASDVKIQKDEIEYLTDAMIETQSFFASEMDRYGFGEKTFAFDDIEIVEAKLKLRQYTSLWTIQRESTVIEWGLDNQIYVVFLGGTGEIGGNTAISQQLCANIPEQLIYCNNLVVVPTAYREILLPLLAHEIGHAFSLDHAPKRLIANQVDVMYLPLHVTPGVTMTLKDFALNQKDAEFLEAGDRLSVQQSPQETAIDADVNKDGYVDLYDVLIVRSGMNQSVKYDTDINDDGVTDEVDLHIVKSIAMQAIAAASPRKRKVKLTTWAGLKRR